MAEPIPLYQVDAFTDRPFAGNPAAVCLYEEWLPDATLQAIAAEMNLSETAFLVPSIEDEEWHLRWFTPACEVDLCGHATLAAAWVLLQEVQPERDKVVFHTASGALTVRRAGEDLELDFPARAPEPCREIPALLAAGLGAAAEEVQQAAGHSLLALFPTEDAVRGLRPDVERLRDLGKRVIATAAADEEGVDFVSRFFAPVVGVDEDPVTGSAHCTLAPYWAARLGKDLLEARQVSARGGALTCEVRGERVRLRGRAVIVLRGEMMR